MIDPSFFMHKVGFADLAILVAVVVDDDDGTFTCCFWEIFSYKGFTFFKYLLMTSLALLLVPFCDEVGDDDIFFGSFRNTEESFDKENFDGFLIGLLSRELTLFPMHLKFSMASSETELGREDSGWSWLRSLEKEE